MYPEDSKPLYDLNPLLRVFGAVLTMLGVAIVGLVVWYVHTVLTSPEAFPMIVSLMPKEAVVVLQEDAKALTIPREIVQGSAYIVFAILLGVLGGLARTLIAAGTGLLKFASPQPPPSSAPPKTKAATAPHID